ncbi:MAG: hypothetical protein ACJATA_001570 [Sphingobacteriales bacterium]|jgi:hypothetical protein
MTTPLKQNLIFFLLALSTVLSGCYSFTGASIPVDVKDFNIKYFENQANIVVPSLSQTLTEKLRSRVQTQTTLKNNSGQADVTFEGFITKYETRPLAIQGNQTAQDNRLTITISINYLDVIDEKRSWKKDFTRFADYGGAVDLSSVETALIDQITTELVEDVFNKAFVNW